MPLIDMARLPVETIVPFPVAEDVEMEEAAWVVTVGADVDIVVVERMEPNPVPPELVAYALK